MLPPTDKAILSLLQNEALVDAQDRQKAIPVGTPSHYLWQVWAEDCDEVKVSKEGVNKGRIFYKCPDHNVSYFQNVCLFFNDIN